MSPNGMVETKKVVGYTDKPELTDTSKKLVRLFNWCQSEDVSISKAVKELRKLFDDINESKERRIFFSNLVFMLQVPLVNGTSKERPNKFDEKLFEVVCRFSSSFVVEALAQREKGCEGDEELNADVPWIMKKLFVWLLDRHEVSSSCARLRICMLINWLLKHLGDSFEIEEAMYKKIFANMFERLKDKVAEIRAQAVTALHRLQNPRDPECPVIKAFLFHLGCDPSPLVRRTVIKNIGTSKTILGYIIRRTSDVDEGVRVAAFAFLCEKVHMRSLTIACREEVLKKGLADPSKKVNKIVAKELIQTWLSQFNGNIVDFLFLLDVRCSDGDGKTAGDCLAAVFTGVPYHQLIENFTYLHPATKLIPSTELTPETVVYWKNLVKFLYNEAHERGVEDAETQLDKLLPELTDFCNYIREFFLELTNLEADGSGEDKKVSQEINSAFVGRALIEMTIYFDLSDEAGRRNLQKLCKSLLSNDKVGAGFVESIMKIYNKVEARPEIKIQEIAEIISDLRDPLQNSAQRGLLQTQQLENERKAEIAKAKLEAEKKEEDLRHKQVELAKMRLRLNELKDSMDKAIIDQDFLLAQTLKQEVDSVSLEQIKLHEEIQKDKANFNKNEEDEPMVEDYPIAPTQTYRDDPRIVLKCLIIISEFLRPKQIMMSPILRTLLDEFVVPTVSSVSSHIRNAAVKSIGCLCLRDAKASKKHMLLVLQICLMDELTVRLTAVKVIIDILMYQGSAPFITDDEDKINNSDEDLFEEEESRQSGQLTQANLNSGGVESVVKHLCQLLDDGCDEIRTLVVEGLCKLMLSGIIISPKLVSRFVLLWSNPVVERNSVLFHVLGAFLQLYPSLSSSNQEAFHESFMITMRTLIAAPFASPLSQISIETVGMFYVDLTRKNYLQDKKDTEEISNIHDDLALTLANEILKTPDANHIKCFVKLLLYLELTPDKFTSLRDLRDLTRQMAGVIVQEKNLIKNLEKFEMRLDEMLKKAPKDTSKTNVEPEQLPNETSIRESPENQEESNLEVKSPESMKTSNGRKRTLFNENDKIRLDISSDDCSQPNHILTSTQIDDTVDFNIESTTSQSSSEDGCSSKKRIFLSPLKPEPKESRHRKASKSRGESEMETSTIVESENATEQASEVETATIGEIESAAEPVCEIENATLSESDNLTKVPDSEGEEDSAAEKDDDDVKSFDQTESEVEKEEESETDIFKVNNKDESAALTSADSEKEFAKQAEPELKVAARKPKQEKEAASKQAKQKMDKSVDMEQEVVAKAVSRSRRKLTSSSSPETQGTRTRSTRASRTSSSVSVTNSDKIDLAKSKSGRVAKPSSSYSNLLSVETSRTRGRSLALRDQPSNVAKESSPASRSSSLRSLRTRSSAESSPSQSQGSLRVESLKKKAQKKRAVSGSSDLFADTDDGDTEPSQASTVSVKRSSRKLIQVDQISNESDRRTSARKKASQDSESGRSDVATSPMPSHAKRRQR